MSLTNLAEEYFQQSGAMVGQLATQDIPKTSPTRMLAEDEFERLQHQATRLEHLLQVMPAGVVVLDGQGIVRQANKQARDMLGEPLQGQVWRNIIQRSFNPQADDGHEVSLHDGRKVKLSITPLVNEPGQLIVITDLTETRQLQERISHMQRLSALGKTVASLVHQIRTPLSAAILYAANLAHPKLADADRGRFADKLQSRLRDLESQVNDMLLFAKSGEQQVVKPLGIQELFLEVKSGVEAMLQQQGADMSVSTPTHCPGILGNQPALTGAIQNLIHNAVQVTGKGARLQLSARQSEQDPNHLIIQVKDNGPGIDQAYLEKIFEPFFTRRSQGTGLGLAVVSSVAKAHHGSVSASNLPQGGACFTLRLPVQQTGQASVTSEDKV